MLVRELTEAEKARLAPLRGASKAGRNYSVGNVELREAEDGSTKVKFYGHASVTAKGYDMYGGPEKGGWTEFVDPGAFKKTLSEKPDVAFLANHGGLTLARTTAGSLALSEDDIGLEVHATLDKRVTVANDVAILIEGGELNEMSFAFRVMRQVWRDADGEEVPWWDLSGVERHLTEVSIHKGDVSIVNYGANPYTDATLRSLEEQAELRAAILRAPDVAEDFTARDMEMRLRLLATKN